MVLIFGLTHPIFTADTTKKERTDCSLFLIVDVLILQNVEFCVVKTESTEPC